MTPLALALSLALAHDDGINGYSGKQGVICNQCHNGGTAPTVALTGPSTLTPGESAQYTFTITGGAGARGGFNVAEAGGATFTAGTGQKMLNGELTHQAPQVFTAGSTAFAFMVTAPGDAGTVVLFAAGNSVNNNTTNQGDKAASTMLTITVAPTPPPPVVDAGTPSQPTPSQDGGTTGAPVADAGSVSAPGASAVVALPGEGDPEGGVIDGGCSAAGGAPLLGLLALVLSRKRRSA